MSHASRPNGSSVTEQLSERRACRKAVLLMRTEDLQLQRGSRRPALRSDCGPCLFNTHTFHRRNIIGSPSAFFFFSSSSVLSPPPASHSHTPLAGAEHFPPDLQAGDEMSNPHTSTTTTTTTTDPPPPPLFLHGD